jgi:hypothetical protein
MKLAHVRVARSAALGLALFGLIGCAGNNGPGATKGGSGGQNTGSGGRQGSGGSAGNAGGSASNAGSGGSQSNAGSGGTTGSGGGTTGSGGGTGSGGTGGSSPAGTGGAAAGTGGSAMAPDAGGPPASGPVVYPYDKCNFGAPVITKLAASTNPPGGLAVTNVPQLVSIGFDDNAHEDGMAWILDFMKAKANPAGKGNPCTFDGTAARVSFFNNSHVEKHTDAIAALHARAFREGHEAGNHTDSHADTLQQNPNKDVWTKEIVTCNDYLVGLGVPRERIVGFRTPFLQHSEATFQAVVEQKFRYDCSIEHFYGQTGFVWPYTLDDGKTMANTYLGFPQGKYPGLWELPVNELQTSNMGFGSVTGLDYNMWISKRMSRQQVVETLKTNLEIRMKGGNAPANRSPMLVGAHTDLYANDNPDAMAGNPASIADRRAAIEEFITWALAYHPDVRIVPHAEVLRWMQSPVGLDGTRAK